MVHNKYPGAAVFPQSAGAAVALWIKFNVIFGEGEKIAIEHASSWPCLAAQEIENRGCERARER